MRPKLSEQKLQRITTSLGSKLQKYRGSKHDDFSKIVSSGDHFDWWFINSYPNSSAPDVGYYSLADATNLIKDPSYMEAWRGMVGKYFSTMGIKTLYEKDPKSQNFTKFLANPYYIRLSKIISSIQVIHATAANSGMYDLAREMEALYSSVYSSFYNQGALDRDSKLDSCFKPFYSGESSNEALSKLYFENSGEIFSKIIDDIKSPSMGSNSAARGSSALAAGDDFYSPPSGSGNLSSFNSGTWEKNFLWDFKTKTILVTGSENGMVYVRNTSPQEAVDEEMCATLSSCMIGDRKTKVIPYKDEGKTRLRIEFNIDDFNPDLLTEFPLLQYYRTTRNLDDETTNEIVSNLIEVIVNLDRTKRTLSQQRMVGKYVELPILVKKGYPPLAMYLDPKDGEISMKPGCGGSIDIMKNIIHSVEEKVKKHPTLREFFYENPRAGDANLREINSRDGHYEGLYLTKPLLARMQKVFSERRDERPHALQDFSSGSFARTTRTDVASMLKVRDPRSADAEELGASGGGGGGGTRRESEKARPKLPSFSPEVSGGSNLSSTSSNRRTINLDKNHTVSISATYAEDNDVKNVLTSIITHVASINKLNIGDAIAIIVSHQQENSGQYKNQNEARKADDFLRAIEFQCERCGIHYPKRGASSQSSGVFIPPDVLQSLPDISKQEIQHEAFAVVESKSEEIAKSKSQSVSRFS